MRATIAFIGVLLVTGSSSAAATMIDLTGSFSATFDSGSPITSLTASFSGSYDEVDLVPAVPPTPGVELLYFYLDSITLTPDTIGSTTFDVTNTLGRALYTDSILTSIIIGGASDGLPQVLDPTGDWYAIWNIIDGSAVSEGVVYRFDDVLYADFAAEQSLVLNSVSVPEPGTFSLLLFGSFVMMLATVFRGPSKKAIPVLIG